MAYKLMQDGGVLRLADGASIPPDPGNRDWRRFLAWEAAGNRAAAADPPPPPAERTETVAELRATVDRLTAALIGKSVIAPADIAPPAAGPRVR